MTKVTIKTYVTVDIDYKGDVAYRFVAFDPRELKSYSYAGGPYELEVEIVESFLDTKAALREKYQIEKEVAQAAHAVRLREIDRKLADLEDK